MSELTQRSAATGAAQRLWARSAGDARAPEEIAAAAERMCAQLREGLARWIGAEGYRVLFDRSLGLVRADHPALAGISCLGGDEPEITAAVRAHGAGELAAGMVALVAALTKLLGRIIGEEMAVRLVEQIGHPSPRGIVSTQIQGGPDG